MPVVRVVRTMSREGRGGKAETRARGSRRKCRRGNDPRAEIRRRDGCGDEHGRHRDGRREGGEHEGQKGFPKAPYGALCKRDIKISLQIAPTTFPFRSRSACRIEA